MNMSFVINTNIGSLNAQRSLDSASELAGKAMERLSSGKKINSAADDAAGFAIVERQTSQIRGLNMAIKNANDGLSLVSTVGQAAGDITDILQRLRELNIQSQNGINGNTDLTYLRHESQALVEEIDRIANHTTFNNKKLMDGSLSEVGYVMFNYPYSYVGSGAADDTNPASSATYVSQNGSVTTTIDYDGGNQETAKTVAAKVNATTETSGLKANARTEAMLQSFGGPVSISLNGVSISWESDGNTPEADIAAINAVSNQTGVVAQSANDGRYLYLIDEDGDGNGERVLGSEAINDIEVDGANKKWFGTANNGVFYTNSNGRTQLQRFSKTNSPLASDVILDIEIDDQTGMVHFGTDQGIVSYQGQATAGEKTMSDVFAYPNPVEPGYSGPILIRGLVTNAQVKITDVEGNIVFESLEDDISLGLDPYDIRNAYQTLLMGKILKIAICNNTGEKIFDVKEVEAIAGKGLIGDRHFKENNNKKSQITFIEIENINYYNQISGTSVPSIEFRRNIVTEGIKLNDLVGREFLIGNVKFKGHDLCHPCKQLGNKLIQENFVKKLINKGGLRCEILTNGKIFVGDKIKKE